MLIVLWLALILAIVGLILAKDWLWITLNSVLLLMIFCIILILQ